MQLLFDLYNNRVTTTISGPQNQTGNLSVVLTGDQGSRTIAAANRIGPGTYAYTANLTSLGAGEYTSVSATWANSQVSIPIGFNVLQTLRFSSYNIPHEDSCAGSPKRVYVFENDRSCTYTYNVTFASDFVSQTNINGTGSSLEFGLVAPYNSTYLKKNWCYLPSGASANGTNTFVKINSVMGSCHKTLFPDVTVAVSPNHTFASSRLKCADQVLLLNSSGQADSIKIVLDDCPGCSSQFNGTNGHIDSFVGSPTCDPSTLPDYGIFFTIRLR